MKRLAACLVGLILLAAAAISAAGRSREAQRLVYIGTYTGETSKGIYAFRFDDSSGELTPLGPRRRDAEPELPDRQRRRDGRVRGQRAVDLQGAPGGSVTLVHRRSRDRQADRDQRAADARRRALSSGARSHRQVPGGGELRRRQLRAPAGRRGRHGCSRRRPSSLARGRTRAARSRWAMRCSSPRTTASSITADKGLNRMLVFRFDAAKGTLTPNQPPSADAAARIRSAALRAPSERAVAVHHRRAGGHDHDVRVGRARPARLTPTGSVPTRPAGVTTGSTAEIAVHPSGSSSTARTAATTASRCSASATRAR